MLFSLILLCVCFLVGVGFAVQAHITKRNTWTWIFSIYSIFTLTMVISLLTYILGEH